MKKILRSLIHEVFPFDLRVEIDLLSRRRDISNEEKQDELLKLLRKYEIQNVSQLGPGTNRYACRINGFVVKFATDNDGKIDNMKEFKMAKVFYPDVTKIYEISSNGTLLVAEYIQPFTTYGELLKYADKIRAILSKISSVCLIGDVGISEVNVSNWGLRIGSDEPVCLDFAYVYEVSSSLFICRHCNTQSMLVPNKDFSYLICSNPACAKITKFEDIRGLIGNDLHRHEIGDLTQEGYVLYESNVETVLTENRSNYLARHKNGNSNKHKNTEKLDSDAIDLKVDNDNNIDNNPQYYESEKKEETEMNGNNNGFDQVVDAIRNNIRVTAVRTIPGGVAATKKPVKPTQVKVTATAKPKIDTNEDSQKVVTETERADTSQQEPVVESKSQLAFSGPVVTSVSSSPVQQDKPKVLIVPKVVVKPHESENHVEEKPVVKEEPKKNADENVDAENVLPKVESKPVDVQPQVQNAVDSGKAVSWVANRMSEYLHVKDAFNECKGSIRDKRMNAETFYKSSQNAIYRSLVAYLGFIPTDVPNKENPKRFHKEFVCPDVDTMETEKRISVDFINKLYESPISGIEDIREMMEALENDPYIGDMAISHDWIPVLHSRIIEKMAVYNHAADIICDIIERYWCSNTQQQEETQGTNTNDNKAIESNDKSEEVESVIQNTIAEEPQNTEETGNDDTESDQDSEDYEDDDYLMVGVILGEGDEPDVLRINSSDAYGGVVIPFYGKLEETIPESESGELYQNRYYEENGVWDWLANMIPDMAFTTKNPKKWMQVNDIEPDDEQTKIVIVDYDDKTQLYIMGMYMITSIAIIDKDGNPSPQYDMDFLERMNMIFMCGLNWSPLSYRDTLCSMKEGIHTEDYMYSISTDEMKEALNNYKEEDEEHEDGERFDPPTEAEMAAIESMISKIDDNGEENSSAAFQGPIGPNGEIRQIN